MANEKVIQLAESFDLARQLTKFYLSKLKGQDVHQRIEAGGQQLNSIYWFVGHLIWAEHNLLVIGTGGKPIEGFEKWNVFKIGEKHKESYSFTYEELWNDFKMVHEYSLKRLSEISDLDLSKPNTINLRFIEKNDIATLIMHAVRHEASHAGQLGILCKLLGIPTV